MPVRRTSRRRLIRSHVGAWLGIEFTIGSLAAGLDVDPLAIEEPCDELVRQGQFLSAAELFVRPDGANVARYRFTHSLYPHAIAERVPAGRRLRIHQRVGELLERTYGTQATTIAGLLAWHFEEAGDYRRAIRYLILTAENAAGRLAYGDATRGTASLEVGDGEAVEPRRRGRNDPTSSVGPRVLW